MFEFDTNYVYYRDLVCQLEKQCISFENKLDQLKSSEFDASRDDDVRLSFYYLAIQNIEAAIHLLILSNFVSKEKKALTSLYVEYGLRDRSLNNRNQVLPFERIRYNNSQFIANQYFISIYSLFEHCIRFILKECIKDFKQSDLISIKKMVEYVLETFHDQNEYIKKFDIDIFYAMNSMRNAVHSNGLYMPPTKDPQNENKVFRNSEAGIIVFNYNNVIQGKDVWKKNIFMISELLKLFNAIIEIPKIKSNHYIEDPSAATAI